jgi:hypothetical protein
MRRTFSQSRPVIQLPEPPRAPRGNAFLPRNTRSTPKKQEGFTAN